MSENMLHSLFWQETWSQSAYSENCLKEWHVHDNWRVAKQRLQGWMLWHEATLINVQPDQKTCTGKNVLYILHFYESNITNACHVTHRGNYIKNTQKCHTIITSSVICQTTGPKPLAKQFLHIVRSRASSFNSQYPLLSLRSSSNFLRLLPCLLVISICPFIFPSIIVLEASFYVRCDQSS